MQAATHVLRGKYEDAEKLLTQALDKSPNDADTLQNLATVSHLAGKGTEVGVHMSIEHRALSLTGHGAIHQPAARCQAGPSVPALAGCQGRGVRAPRPPVPPLVLMLVPLLSCAA